MSEKSTAYRFRKALMNQSNDIAKSESNFNRDKTPPISTLVHAMKMEKRNVVDDKRAFFSISPFF
jgi:hypothetical protein